MINQWDFHMVRNAVVLVVLLTAQISAFGQFTGADDFDDGTLDLSKWSLLAEVGATFEEDSGYLRLVPGATNEFLSHYTVCRWKSAAPANTNWMFQVDLRIPYSRAPSNSVIFSVFVVPSSPVINQEEWGVWIDGPRAAVEYSRGYDRSTGRSNVGHVGSFFYGPVDLEQVENWNGDDSKIEIFSTQISFRFRWLSSEKVLITEYDSNGLIDGYNWTISATRHLEDYEWDLSQDFAVCFDGYCEHEDPTGSPGAAGSLNAKPHGFDNFRAQTLPNSPSAARVTRLTSESASTEIEIVSEPGASYTLESTTAVNSFTWTPVESVVSEGSTTNLRDRPSTGAIRFYRVRSP